METATPRRFTVAEYHLMGDAGVLAADERLELLDGAVVEMSPIGDRHMVRHARIVRQLLTKLGERFIVYGQGSFPIGSENEPQPDIAIGPALDAREERKPPVAALLAVIELAETSQAMDLGFKMRLYARGRVPKYLVVDLVADVLVAHAEPHDLGYAEVVTFGKGDAFTLDGIPGETFAASDFLSPS